MMMERRKKEAKGRWFRCPKCLKTAGPFPESKDVAFCPHCGMMMAEVDEERAKKKALID